MTATNLLSASALLAFVLGVLMAWVYHKATGT